MMRMMMTIMMRMMIIIMMMMNIKMSVTKPIFQIGARDFAWW